jgi:hypothetical protein
MDGSDIFNRGASIPREVYLYNYDTEGPIDLDTLTEITFEVLHTTTNRVLGTYTLTGGTITKQDAANGIAWFDVGQSNTTTAKRGDYLLRVSSEETDANYESSTHIRTGMAFCFKLI